MATGAPAAIILAAGQGTRMKSDLLKVLHPVGGRPMLLHVVDRVEELGAHPLVVVVGYQADRVKELLGERAAYTHQDPLLGTAHAALQAEALVARHRGPLLVMYGDTPLLRREALEGLLETHAATGAACALVTAEVGDPTGYGRVLRREGKPWRVVEEADCTPEQAGVREINAGIYCFEPQALFAALRRVEPRPPKGEFYLVDVVQFMVEDGLGVEAVKCRDPESVLGVNDRRELARAESTHRRRVLEALMDRGVTVVDPQTTYVAAGVEVGRDAVIHPFSVVEAGCSIGPGAQVGPYAYLVGAELAEGARVVASVVEHSRLGPGAQVGPYSHLRPGSVLEAGARVGNFAEVKNTRIGRGSKVPHHSYVGDAQVGEGVNIGAGTVTVNYDGREKHPTVIGDGAFVGCNSNLIAPVEVGAGAYVAAGSTITRPVPSGALGVGRSRQENIEGWVGRRFGRQRAGRGGRREPSPER